MWLIGITQTHLIAWRLTLLLLGAFRESARTGSAKVWSRGCQMLLVVWSVVS
jgi:hypothetical protein